MPWLTPKTDWTADDYFNFTDLDRIESNTAYLATLLAEFGYSVIITTFVGRSVFRFEFADDLDRIEGNINAIAVIVKPDGWETCKTNWLYKDGFDYQVAKRMERNLELQHLVIQGNIDHMPYAGAFYSGEARI